MTTNYANKSRKYRNNLSSKPMVFLLTALVVFAIGSLIPNSYATENCFDNNGQACYAVSRFFPSNNVEGMKSSYKALDHGLSEGFTQGWILGASWAKTTAGKIIETGWKDEPSFNLHFYCALDGIPISAWTTGLPSDGTTYNFKIEHDSSNNWATIANNKICSLPGGSSVADRIDFGYETSYGDIELESLTVTNMQLEDNGSWENWLDDGSGSDNGQYQAVEVHWQSEYQVDVVSEHDEADHYTTGP